MATVISFDHEVEYLDTPDGRAPALMVAIENPRRPGRSMESIAYLDTGAERTLFDGEMAESLGINIFDGRKVLCSPTRGGSFGAREHEVILSHPSIGRLRLTVYFSEEPIRRMLLGRDFFELMQIGFRQYEQMFFLSPPE